MPLVSRGYESEAELSNVKRTTELLDLWQAGDTSARDRLLEHCCERLRILVRKMLRQQFPHVGRWEQTDDVLQRALLRLHQSLNAVNLESGRHFHNLAATQIRRELIELARHYYGPQGHGSKHETDGCAEELEGRKSPKHDQPDWSGEPSSLAQWSEFHRQIEQLPDEERAVVELLWYQGLTQEEAAEVLDVTDRTVRRRWVSARTRLYDAFGGEPPV
jgi:RNA polymerase sigma-70 factor (ECF subfamily)